VPAQGEPPFESITKPEYSARFGSDDAQAVETRESIVVSGRCPRCDHEISFDFSKRVYKGWLPRLGRTSKPVVRKSLSMMCTCVMDHRSRPADQEGCGAYWCIEVLPE
jgi:hypothetical protein